MKWKGQKLTADTVYIIEHLHYHLNLSGVEPMHTVRVRPIECPAAEREYLRRNGRTRLDVVTLPAGTLLADAGLLLWLAVPLPYRDLGHSIELDHRHLVTWVGERRWSLNSAVA